MVVKFSSARAAASALALSALGCGAASTAAVAAGAGPNLLAHRAVYDLSLARSDTSSSAPIGARGRIVYEFTGSPCEGWVTNFRQLTQLQMSEGADRTSDMRSTTFEEADGSSFAFKTDTFLNGKLVESVDGRARKAEDGRVSVNLSKPSPAKADVGPGPVFPTAQIVRIIAAAKAGDKTDEMQIFDGSDTGQKVFDTMAVIGHEKTGDAPEPAAASADALKGVPRWPVSVSYFDPSKRDSEPNYILAFDLYENGVSSGLRIDYGSYVLDGKMTKFEPLKQKACDK